jgi:hypothetical protein
MSQVRNARSRRGSAAVVCLFLVVICAAISAAALVSNVGATREAETLLSRERAYQAAEAGLDWALTKMRISHGVLPEIVLESAALNPSASYEIRYAEGDEDGIDEDGDGTVDDADESDFSTITCTGTSNGVKRTVQAIIRRAVDVPDFPGTALVNTDVPVIDLNGNAFTIGGAEHLLDGSVDSSRPQRYAVASLATTVQLITQISATRVDQLTGTGTVPSVGQTAELDLPGLVANSISAANYLLAPGTYSGETYGSATEDGIVVVACDGDLHLSGGSAGAGILAVDGDLEVSGGFEWVGLILVTGRVTMTGGGSGTRLIGAIVAGEELRTTGTIDLLYSSDAVGLASLGLSLPQVLTRRETGNP